MKMNYNTWAKILLVSTIFVTMLTISIILSIFINPKFMILMIFSIMLILLSGCEFGDDIPDYFHMSRRCQYKIFGNGYRFDYIHVKMFPGIWVETEYSCSLEKFMEIKIDYQHAESMTL